MSVNADEEQTGAGLYTQPWMYARDVTNWSAVRVVVRVFPLSATNALRDGNVTSHSSMPLLATAGVVALDAKMVFSFGQIYRASVAATGHPGNSTAQRRMFVGVERRRYGYLTQQYKFE